MDIRNMVKEVLKEYDPRLRPNYLGMLGCILSCIICTDAFFIYLVLNICGTYTLTKYAPYSFEKLKI